MSGSKLRVAVLFGGRSAEHEISLFSARFVVEMLDRERFEPILIGIDKSGRWLLQERRGSSAPRAIRASPSSTRRPRGRARALPGAFRAARRSPSARASARGIDVVFPRAARAHGRGRQRARAARARPACPYVGGGRARLRRRHGQGRDEAAARRRGAADRPVHSDDPPPRVGQGRGRLPRSPAALGDVRLREAGEPGLLRRGLGR
jgi:hypothetical protein